jgi:hypothetical protein
VRETTVGHASLCAVVLTFNPTRIAQTRAIDRRLAQLKDDDENARLRVVHEVLDESRLQASSTPLPRLRG